MADVFCIGCDIPLELNHQGLCESCTAKLERDLIRSRDWDYSTRGAWTSDEQQEELYQRIIRDYGSAYELLENPNKKKKKGKNKRSKSRATQRKREIAANAIREYAREDIFARIEVFLNECEDDWVNFSHVSQLVYETYHKFKPRRMGQPGKKYKSLLKVLQDYPELFAIRVDDDNPSLFYIRLTD